MAKIIDSYNQAKDTGLAMVLVLLLLAHFGKFNSSLLPAIAVLVITMTWPTFFAPLAKLWFGLSHLLGGYVSKVLLTIVFFLVASPVSLLRRAGGADAMLCKAWKDGRLTAFVERVHEFSRKDLKTPY